MSTYILVHGAWHGAWCWHKVAPLLRSAGHSVYTPDLPGHGKNRSAGNVITTTDYVNSLHALVLEQNQPVILVGHSMGGMVISQLAELIPDKIRTLVYLAGFLLVQGESINDFESRVEGSLLAPNLVMSKDKSSLRIPKHNVREALYSDCNETDYQYALAHLQPQPVLPFLTPVNLLDARHGIVPKVYIECLLDKALPVSAQRFMYGRTVCNKIFSLEAAHSPFFSVYNNLANTLMQI